jgi:hypothetical protein
LLYGAIVDGKVVGTMSPLQYKSMKEIGESTMRQIHAYNENQEPVGLIVPQRFPDVPHGGTIMTIGVLPNFRRKGLGKIVHAKDLEFRSAQVGIDYIGSTDIINVAMINVFKTNGCTNTGVRTVHRHIDSIHLTARYNRRLPSGAFSICPFPSALSSFFCPLSPFHLISSFFFVHSFPYLALAWISGIGLSRRAASLTAKSGHPEFAKL